MNIGLSEVKKEVGSSASNPVRLTNEQVARAWQSPEYRQSLTAEQQKALPGNPAGGLQAQEKGRTMGVGGRSIGPCTIGNCTGGSCTLGGCTAGPCTNNSSCRMGMG